MVVAVYGFPSKTYALQVYFISFPLFLIDALLQFEWTLQHPTEARRFQDVVVNMKKIGNWYMLKAKLRFLHEMLHVTPFSHLPLTVHWFTER